MWPKRARERSTGGGLWTVFRLRSSRQSGRWSKRWNHTGNSEWWAGLDVWPSTVGQGWPHDRDLQQGKLEVGETLCRRTDCVASMYSTVKTRYREKGSLIAIEIGQRHRWVDIPQRASRYDGKNVYFCHHSFAGEKYRPPLPALCPWKYVHVPGVSAGWNVPEFCGPICLFILRARLLYVWVRLRATL